MRKSLFYSLFGSGKVLGSNRERLEAEGIVLMDEGVPASMTLVGFSGMGRCSSWRIRPFAGALVLTKTRLYANSHMRVVVDIPLADSHMHCLEVSANDRGRLEIDFNAADFIPAKGKIRLRFHTPQAQAYLQELTPFLGLPDGAAK
jgi:hypothetical protein